MRAETLKGHLDGLLLSVLETGPRHGYAVIEAVRSGSGGAFDLPTGTVYPALHRLERAGLIHATWSVVGGRRRRTYELTVAGRRMLDTERRLDNGRLDNGRSDNGRLDNGRSDNGRLDNGRSGDRGFSDNLSQGRAA